MDSPTIAEAVGAQISQARHEHGLTLEQIAETSRAFGARWSASSVLNLEQGRASMTLQNLLYLATTLELLTGQPYKLIDLLGDEQTLSLHERNPVIVNRQWLKHVLDGAPVRLPRIIQVSASPTQASTPCSRRPMNAEAMPAYTSMAETRAATKLGINPIELQHQAIQLWGHNLETEQHRRAGEQSTAQKRGRVTRHLVEEMRAAMA